MDQLTKCDHAFHDKWAPNYKKLGEEVNACAQKSQTYLSHFTKLKHNDHRHEILDTCDANYAKCRENLETQLHHKLIKDSKTINDCYRKVLGV